MKIRNILCSTDFSEFSRRALEQAVTVARWYGAELTVVHVYPFMAVGSDAPYFASGLPLDARTRASLLNDLEGAAAPARAAGVPTKVLLLEGDPSEEILRRARTAPTDLIVMGTHGRRGFDRWILGSVATRVVQRARCAVLTVPKPREEAGPVVSAYETILCPVDLLASEHTIEAGVSVANASQGRLTLLHVLEHLRDRETIARLAHIEWRDFEARLERDTRTRLREAALSQGARVDSVDEWVMVGKPYREILNAAEARGATLIVMGIHGSGPIERLFVGSTALQVLRGAQCPVLTVRSSEGGAK
jgi:nucleotide-binding universal stress UspA family protein